MIATTNITIVYLSSFKLHTPVFFIINIEESLFVFNCNNAFLILFYQGKSYIPVSAERKSDLTENRYQNSPGRMTLRAVSCSSAFELRILFRSGRFQ